MKNFLPVKVLLLHKMLHIKRDKRALDHNFPAVGAIYWITVSQIREKTHKYCLKIDRISIICIPKLIKYSYEADRFVSAKKISTKKNGEIF